MQIELDEVAYLFLLERKILKASELLAGRIRLLWKGDIEQQ